MHPEYPSRRSTRRPRMDRNQRAELATVDCLTIQVSARQAEDYLRDGELSAALVRLEAAEQALRRARKMIQVGQ